MAVQLDEFGMVVLSSGNSGGGGGAPPFYRCATVDPANRKWTGYLALIDPGTGAWSFAKTATTGLTYTYPVPVVGSVYAGENCLCKVSDFYTGFPTDGLIFYLPLAEDADYDVTGKAIDKLNPQNITYTTFQGVPCANIGYRAQINGPDFASLLPNSSSTRFTFSCWGYFGSGWESTSHNIGFFSRTASGGQYPATDMTGVMIASDRVQVKGYGKGTAVYDLSNTGMAHYAVTYDGNALYLYRNGTQVTYLTTNVPFGSMTAYYPGTTGESYNYRDHYSAAIRVYDRVLTLAEITTLAGEFTPVAEQA